VPAPCKVGIIAALEREVWPFIRDWTTVRSEFDGRDFKFFEKKSVVLVCGGIGAEAARRAAEAIVNLYRPELLISAGFAGGLDPAFPIGQVVMPRYVIDAKDGSRTDCGTGEGLLISFAAVANVEQKNKLWQAYGAQIVDMEAAAVARSAEAHGIKFLACKVISDTSRSTLPPISSFVDRDGRFHSFGFIAHVALRPWLWAKVYRLASDSAIAAQRLCSVLTENFGSFSQDRDVPVLRAQKTRW